MNNVLAQLEPIPTLLARLRRELGGEYDTSRPLRLSRAPGRLDVMGGVADYTGSMVCEATLDRAAAVALQERDDRFIHVFGLDLLNDLDPADPGWPWAYRIPVELLCDVPNLRRHLDAEPHPARSASEERRYRWAGYLLGCFALLHERGLIDLRDPRVRGVNLALLSTVPPGAGVSSSAAIEVATMMNLRDHFGLATRMDAMMLAEMCQQVENRVVGAPCGVMDQVASCLGEAGTLLRMVCQPHETLPPLAVPTGVRCIGINSNVRHSVGGGRYGRTRCAAFMAHRIILEAMRTLGQKSDHEMVGDPMNGYLANLDPDDYKQWFRPTLPEVMRGSAFVERYRSTIDTATTVEPDVVYHVRQAADHHVLEARRVRRFVEFLEEAARHPTKTRQQGSALDKAGHLMYASHLSYTNDALLGAEECDLLVALIRKREKAGIYGAKITGGGSGGTVAVLADEGPRVDAALGDIMAEYERQTGRKPEAFSGTSPGAWQVGTALVPSTHGTPEGEG